MPKKFEQTKANQCAYINLHDISILQDVKLPHSITDITLWYRKEGEEFWGLTAKAFDNENDISSNNFSIKISWIYRDLINRLVPTKASEEFTCDIEGELLEKLKDIKEKHQAKQSKKRTTKSYLKDEKKATSISSKN
jgi:hypothetical protein